VADGKGILLPFGPRSYVFAIFTSRNGEAYGVGVS